MDGPIRDKPRVLLIHNYLSAYRVALFSELATRFDLDIWILGDIRQLREWPKEAPGATFRYTNLPNLCIPVGSRYNAILINYTLPAALIRHRHDVILCCAWDTPATFYAAAHARVTHTPFVLWSGSTHREPNLLRTMTRPAVKALVRSADAWIAYGTRAKAYLTSLGACADRTFIAYNTVNLDYFAQASALDPGERARLRESLGIHTPFVVMYCGNLLDLKGVGDLLEAFVPVAEARDDITLLLVGSGKDEPKYRAFAESHALGKRVVFAGFVERPDLPRYYGIADLLVLPSRHEVWGLVINEALACGVPVLATDAPGASADLIQHGLNGYVTPAGDTAALSEAILRHFAPETDRASMAEAARTLIQPFSLSRAADAFTEAVTAALARSR